MESTIDDKKKPNPFLSKEEKKPNPFTSEPTVEKKNLNETGESPTSSTESLAPTSASESPSTGVPQPSSLVSKRQTQQEVQDLRGLAKQNLANNPIPEQKPSPFDGIEQNIAQDPRLNELTQSQEQIQQMPVPEIDARPFDDKLNYNLLDEREKQITSGLLDNMYEEVYANAVNKTDISKEDVSNYLTEKLSSSEIDPLSKVKIEKALNENLFGNEVTGNKGTFESARIDAKKKEQERDIRNTYVEKYGEDLDVLIDDLMGGTVGTEYESTTMGMNEVKSDYISSKDHDLKPESVKALLKGNNSFSKDMVTGVYTQNSEGDEGDKLSEEEAIELYSNGKVKFEDPSRKDFFFGAYKNIAYPKIIEKRVDNTLKGEIRNATGLRDKEYKDLTPEEKIKGFKAFENNVDETIEKIPTMFTDAEIGIKKGYDELIKINNNLQSAKQDLENAENNYQKNKTNETRLAYSQAQTKLEVLEDLLGNKSNELESQKAEVLGFETGLFNPLTGNKMTEVEAATASPDVLKWNQDLIDKTEKYTNNFSGSLQEAKAKQYLKLKEYQSQMLNDSRFGKEEKEKIKNLELFDYAFKSDDMLNNYREAWSELKAITRAEALNLDVKDIPRSKMESFVEGLTNGLNTITGDDMSISTARSEVEDFVNVARENGIEVSDEQLERLKLSVSEEIFSGLGSTLPAMVQLGIAAKSGSVSGAKKAVKGVFAAGKSLKKIKGNKALEKSMDFLEKATINGLEFELGGQSFATGVGETTGKSIAESISLPQGFSKFLSKSPIGRVFSAALAGTGKFIAGATGQTVEEYTGEFFDELSKNPLTEAWATTIGDDPYRKLLVMYTISGTLGLASAPKDYKDAYKKMEDDLLNYDGNEPEILDAKKQVEKKRNLIDKAERTIPTESEDVTTEQIVEEVTEVPIGEVKPTVTEVEGADTEYKLEDGSFLKESEVVELINNKDERLSGITIQNPSETVTEALASKEEVVENVPEETVTQEVPVTQEVEAEVPTPTGEVDADAVAKEEVTEGEVIPVKTETKKPKEVLGTNPSGKVNSTNKKILGKVKPTRVRDAILLEFLSGVKLDRETLTKATGFGRVDSAGNTRGKTEATDKRFLVAKEGVKGTPLDTIAEAVIARMDGQELDTQDVINEILNVVSEKNNETEIAEELLDAVSFDGTIYESVEAKKIAEATAIELERARGEEEWNKRIQEVEITEEEISAMEGEDKFNEYLDKLSDEEVNERHRDYETFNSKGETKKTTAKGESKVPSTNAEKGPTEKVKPTATRKAASSLRDMAAKIRESQKGALNAAIISPELFAKGLDALANILDTVADFNEGIKKFRESDEYKNLEESDRKEIDKIAEAQIEEFAQEEEAIEDSLKKERSVSKNYLKEPNISKEVSDGISEDGRNYIPTSNKITTAEADAIIESKGPDKAKADVLNFKNDIKPAVRVELARQLIETFNTLDPDSAIEIADEISKYATELGQGIQAFSVWNKVSTDGMTKAQENKTKKLKSKHKKDYKDLYEGAKSGYKKGTKEASKKATSKALETKTPSKKRKIKAFGLTKAELKKKKAEALAKFNKSIKGGNLTSGGINPEALSALAELGYYTFAEGYRNFKEWAAEMKESTGITDNEALEAAWNNEKVNNGKTLAELSDIGDLENVVSENYSNGGDVSSLEEAIINAYDVEQDFAKALAKEIDSEFKRIVKKERKKAIKKDTGLTVGKSSKAIEAISESDEALTDEDIDNLIAKEFGIKEMSKELTEKLAELGKERDALPEGYLKNLKTVEMLTDIQKESKIAKKDVFWSLWYASVLSGHETQALNVFSNVMNIGMEGMVSSIQQALIKGDPMAIGKIMLGFLEGLGKGAVEAGEVLSKGQSPTRISNKMEPKGVLENKTFKGGKFNPTNYAKYVGRVMLAVDSVGNLASQGMMKQELARELVRKQAKEGKKKLSEKEIQSKVSEILNDSDEAYAEAMKEAKEDIDIYESQLEKPMSKLERSRMEKVRAYEILEKKIPEEIVQEARTFGDFVTFNYQPKGTIGIIASGLNRLSQELPFGAFKLVVPFTGVVANVLNQMVDYTPYGYGRAMGLTVGGFAPKIPGLSGYESNHAEKGKQRQRALIKATLGTLFMSGLAMMAAAYMDDEDPDFAITGKGPSDYNKKQQLYSKGWKPYSLKIGGTYYSYQYTPLGLGLSFVGNWLDNEKYNDLDKADISTKITFAFQSSGQGVMDMSFLTGISGLMSALSSQGSPERETDKFLKSMGRTATSMIPNFIKQLDKEFYDSTIYDTKDVKAAILSQIPIVKSFSNLKPKLNVFGQEVEKKGSRFSVSVTDDPVWKFMADKELFAPGVSPDRKLPNGELMTDEEFYEFIQISGKIAYDYIKEDMDKLREKDRVDDKEFLKKRISKYFSVARKKATVKIYQKYHKK